MLCVCICLCVCVCVCAHMLEKLDLVNITLQGVLRLDCHRCTVCTGHPLLCEMTLISLLPNLAESISPAIRDEEGREERQGKEGEKEVEEGEAGKEGREEGRGKIGREGGDGEKGWGGVHAYHRLTTRSTICFAVWLSLSGRRLRAHTHIHL